MAERVVAAKPARPAGKKKPVRAQSSKRFAKAAPASARAPQAKAEAPVQPVATPAPPPKPPVAEPAPPPRSAPPSRPVMPSQAPQIAPPAPPAAQTPPAAPAARATPQNGERLLQDGRELFRKGEVLSAREKFVAALTAPLPDVLLELARSYDPHYLDPLPKRDAEADVERARALYEQAAALGSQAAAQDLQRLQAR